MDFMVLYRSTSVINYALQLLVQCLQQVRHKLGLHVQQQQQQKKNHTSVKHIQSNPG